MSTPRAAQGPARRDAVFTAVGRQPMGRQGAGADTQCSPPPPPSNQGIAA